MKQTLGLKSFANLSEKQDIREMMDLRVRETIARMTYYKQIVRKQIVSDEESKTYVLDGDLI